MVPGGLLRSACANARGWWPIGPLGLQVEMESTSATGGRAILVPQDQFTREDTDVKTLTISKQDAEVRDKALTVTLNWWDVGSEPGFLPAEGTPEQSTSSPSSGSC
jgi:hypothetical protein